MIKGDYIWVSGIIVAVVLIASPLTNQIFISTTANHPYIMAFFKFMILASMGELLAIRIKVGKWNKPIGMMYKALVWGLFGIIITLAFQLFSAGVTACQANGYLPGNGSNISFAFLTALLMNVFFAPIFMATHK